MVAYTRKRQRLFETFARVVAAAFGGIAIAIACLGFTALWRGDTGDSPAWYGFFYGALMMLLGLAFTVVAIWPPRESSMRLKATVLGVGTLAGVVFVVALFHGVFGGPPDA